MERLSRKSAGTDPQHVLNGICPYFTMFPLRFPFRLLGRAEKGAKVLDPFCGRGSTNFAARLRGLESVGVDSNPIAVAIAQAKLVETTPGRIAAAARQILDRRQLAREVPTGSFWRRCFSSGTLADLCRLREALLEDSESPTRRALRGLILGCLHGPVSLDEPSYLSNQMPRTYASKPKYALGYWRKHMLQPPRVDVMALIESKAAHFFGDTPLHTRATVLLGNSQTVDLKQHIAGVRWVITSPPYYGMRSYVADQWLRSWFLGGTPSVSYHAAEQLDHFSPEVFAMQLALVWENVATVCTSGAQLIVRFGSIPSRPNDPFKILSDSLTYANCGWSIKTRRFLPAARKGSRQAGQFGLKDSKPITEFDLYARLER